MFFNILSHKYAMFSSSSKDFIDKIEDIKNNAILLIQLLILIFFVAAYNLTQHQDAENHMLPGERQTTSSKELDFRVKCQGRGMKTRS